MKLKFSFFSFPILIFILAGFQSMAQELTFSKVPLPHEISESHISVVQDKNGYMWIASQFGLYRYDGYRFKRYVHDPLNPNSLSETTLELVYADQNGLIWIATLSMGIDQFNPATGVFKHFQNNPNDAGSLSSNIVKAILQDHNGIIWLGTYEGLDQYDPKTNKFRHYKSESNNASSLSCNRVRALYEDRQGSLWVGTGYGWRKDEIPNEGGLNLLNKETGKFTRYLHDPKNPNSLVNNIVHAIFEDSKGTFWIGTAGDGLHTLDRATGKFTRYLFDPRNPEKLSRPALVVKDDVDEQDYIVSIGEDTTAAIWICTSDNGINRFNKETNRLVHFNEHDPSSGFRSRGVWSFCNSKDGIIWIGTIYQGTLYRIDPKAVRISHHDIGTDVLNLIDGPQNDLWLGTRNKGILSTNMDSGIAHKKDLTIFNSLRRGSVYSFYNDHCGSIWIGTSHEGLNRYNINSHSLINFKKFPNDTITSITGNLKDSLYVGTNKNGICIINTQNNSLTFFHHNPEDRNSLGGNSISSIYIDHTGAMWAGSIDNSGSLNYFDRETRIFRHFLNDLKVNVIYEDSDSILWIGTWQGLYKSKNKKATFGFKEFEDSSGMIQNSEIYGIQEDDQKNLWVSSSAGILKINLKTNEFTLFDAINGVDGNLMENCGSYKSSNGELYFGNQRGFYSFRPKDIRLNPQKPRIVFSGLRIGGKSVSMGEGNVLSSPIEQTHEITLKYTQNSFDIDFAGINYANPDYNRHLYMLENYDTAWRVPQNEKTASYSNMPPGEYTLHIKAATSGGEWVENELKIKIIPPWWKRWWAYSFYFICIASGIFITDRIRRKVLVEREQAKTREREIEQAREIEKAYRQLEKAHENLKSTQSQLIQAEKMASLGELTAGIAHEIQNPLNFVNNFSEVNNELIEEMDEEMKTGNIKEAQIIIKDLKENNLKITHHGKRADTIVKGMLQHSRSNSGTKESTDINALANEYLRLSYHGIRSKVKDFNAEISTDFDNTIGKVNLIPQDIGRVLLNLYNNAFYAVGEKNKTAESGYTPSVSVTTKKTVDKIEIRVRDNGIGIPKKVVDKIFQPFFTTKPTGQGTGLGLSLSYDIVKAHGGDIKVDNQEGVYAEFLVSLPIS